MTPLAGFGATASFASGTMTAIARRMSEGTVVVIICDRGDRYLSTNLFTSICAQCPP